MNGDMFSFALTGTNPILFHADDVEAADSLKAWRDDPSNKGRSTAGDDRSPPWTWRTYLYSDGERLVVPSDNIMSALRHAGAQIRTGKGQTTFKSASQSGLLIVQEFCPFAGPRGAVSMADIQAIQNEDFATQAAKVQALGFRLHVKRATVGGSKHVRVRARFDDWHVSGTVQVLDSIITDKVLQQMFDIAGRTAGLLDWRPSSPKKPGPYGTFTAKLKRA